MACDYIPVDFIKAEVRGISPSVFYNNPLLSNAKSIFKGELLTKTIFEYRNIKITVFSNNNRIELSGSLHTLFNEGLHNYNDFHYWKFLTVLKILNDVFKIQPYNLYILQLEWGYNIIPPINSNYILDRCIQHKSVNKTNSIDSVIDGKYIQFKHSQMILKIYNKAQQNKLTNEILRVEIKQINWHKYRKLGIVTLQDFIDYPKSIFLNELINQWERVIFYDIPTTDNVNFLKYQTQTFWDELRCTKSNKAFKYHIDKLKRLNKIYGNNNQEKIINTIIKKGNELQL